MTEVVWENLAKSITDKTNLVDYIEEKLAAHNEDPSAHKQTGEAIDTHRVADILDHLDGSVTVAKLYQDKFYLHPTFESLDAWYVTKTGTGAQAYISPGTLNLIPGTAVGNEARVYIYNAMFDVRAYRNPWFQCLIYIGQNKEKGDMAVAVGAQDPLALSETSFGFRWDSVNSKFYAFSISGAAETKTEIVGIHPSNQPVVRAELTRIGANDSTIKFYVNEVLKATHTNVDFESGSAYIFTAQTKTTVSNPATDLFVRNLYFCQDY